MNAPQETPAIEVAEPAMTFQAALARAMSTFCGVHVPQAMVFDHLSEPAAFILEGLCDERGNHTAFDWLDSDGMVQSADQMAALANPSRVPTPLETVQLRIDDESARKLEELRTSQYPFFTVDHFLAHIIESYVESSYAGEEIPVGEVHEDDVPGTGEGA